MPHIAQKRRVLELLRVAMCVNVERMHYSSSRVSTKGPTKSPFRAHVLLCYGIILSWVILHMRPLAVSQAPFPPRIALVHVLPRPDLRPPPEPLPPSRQDGVGLEQAPASA